MKVDSGEIIDKLTIESEIIQSSFPKGCVMSAEDIALATTNSEIDFISNFDTANQILTTLFEHEKKLQRAFEKGSEQHNQISIIRHQSTPCLNENLVNAGAFSPSLNPSSLPEEDFSESIMQNDSINTSFNFIGLFGFSDKIPVICGYKLLPPLQNYSEFNGAIYEISHIVHSIQSYFDFSPEKQIVPYPSAAILILNKEKRKLYFIPKKTQMMQDIQALKESIGEFLSLCIQTADYFSKKFNLSSISSDYDKVRSLSSILNLTTITPEWNYSALAVIKLSKRLVEIIDKISSMNSQDNGSYSDFITDENGSNLKI
ncbi:hypothetical protein M9Y10_035755 [Tritrichomonas musculus]|uniref:Uncharacterized protein n=1 Tax=Tritrichomonas musculus TaxID=1915356 RepID=A0ABR2GXN9_9EUKA